MEAFVPLGATLKDAFSQMLQYDAGWVAVLDGDSYLGVLTPDSLHAALRRSVDRAEGVEPGDRRCGGSAPARPTRPAILVSKPAISC